MSAEALASGVLSGKVPRDAHVALAGSRAWQLVTEVSEVAAALATRRAPEVGATPTVPPAPPPRTTLPPPMPGMQPLHVPRVAAPPAAVEATMPSKHEDRAAVQPAARARETSSRRALLPLGVFAMFFVLSTTAAVAALAKGRAASLPTDASWIASTLLLGVALLVVGPKSAHVRLLGAAIALLSCVAGRSTDGHAHFADAAAFVHAVSAALSALMLRLRDDERPSHATLVQGAAFGLVAGLSMFVGTCALFGLLS